MNWNTNILDNKKMKIKSLNIDLIILIISTLTMIGGVFYFGELSSLNRKNEIHPLKEYLTNNGIYRIGTAQFIFAILMIVILVNKILQKGKFENGILIYALIFLSILLGIIPWIEMWYGSTFYYGEVRDKQGLGFPKFSLIFLIYPIWIFKEEIRNLNSKQISIRIIATISIIISLSIFYGQIYEPWKLWQS